MRLRQCNWLLALTSLLIFRFPTISFHHLLGNLVMEKPGHLSWKVLHILDLASRFSFYIFQCRQLVRSRGLIWFLFDFGKDSHTYTLYSYQEECYPGFPYLCQKQLLTSPLTASHQSSGTKNDKIHSLWSHLHLLAGTLLYRATLPQRRQGPCYF